MAVTLENSNGTVGLSGTFDLMFTVSVPLTLFGPVVNVTFDLNATLSLVSDLTYAGSATVSATGPGGVGIAATATVADDFLNIRLAGQTVVSIPLRF